jgi:hypothetical protein
MNSQEEIKLRRDQGKAESACFFHSDKRVGVCGDFPELTKAVRERDEAAVSILCAQLFDLNSAAKIRPQPTPIAS